jgi:hypothetical protein
MARMTRSRLADLNVLVDLERSDRRSELSYSSARNLSVVLEILAPRFLPRVTQLLHDPSAAYPRFVGSPDPVEEAPILKSRSRPRRAASEQNWLEVNNPAWLKAYGKLRSSTVEVTTGLDTIEFPCRGHKSGTTRAWLTSVPSFSTLA